MIDWFENFRDPETAITLVDKVINWKETGVSLSKNHIKINEYSTIDSFSNKLRVACQNVLDVLNVRSSLELKIFSGEGDSFTDMGNRIVIQHPVKAFWSSITKGCCVENNEEYLYSFSDLILGLTVHEGSHLIFTQGYTPLVKNNELYDTVFNIIEDERIEYLVSKKYMGFTDYLAVTKAVYFKEVSNINKKTEFEEFMGEFLNAIRFPPAVKDSVYNKYIGLFNQIKKEVTPLYTMDIKKCASCALAITQLIEDFFKKENIEKSRKFLGLTAIIDTLVHTPQSDIKVSGDGSVLRVNYLLSRLKGSSDKSPVSLSEIRELKRFLPKEEGREPVAYSGKLISSKVHKAMWGDTQIFKRQSEKVTPVKKKVILFIDNSYSMGNDGRDTLAKKIAATLVLSMGEIFDFKIISHNSDGTMANLVEWQNLSGFLRIATPYDANADSFGLNYLLKKHREDKPYVFVISDGRPSVGSSNNTRELEEELRSTVRNLTKNGFFIVHIPVCEIRFELGCVYKNEIPFCESELKYLPKKMFKLLLKEMPQYA